MVTGVQLRAVGRNAIHAEARRNGAAYACSERFESLEDQMSHWLNPQPATLGADRCQARRGGAACACTQDLGADHKGVERRMDERACVHVSVPRHRNELLLQAL